MMDTKICDFHSHILPGVDDGSPDIETSLAMLQMSAAQNVGIQVLTPHYYPWKESIEAFLERRAEGIARLEKGARPISPMLLYGAEVAYFRHMSSLDLHPLCIDGKSVLLIEMPFETWGMDVVDEISTLSLDLGYSVVLAHVERYLHYRENPERLHILNKLPIHFQVNAETFLQFRTRGKALSLAREGNILILGSDAHNTTSRRPNLQAARSVVEKKLGKMYLERADEEVSILLEGRR